MTLDEAIKHAEEVAEEQKELYRYCPASESKIFYCDGTKDCKALKNGKNKGCLKCAEEHRQLAEWLKDYKRLLEQEPKTGRCKECKYFESDVVAKVDGIPLIVAHEICSRWADGCKTKEDGYCFLFESQGEARKEGE